MSKDISEETISKYFLAHVKEIYVSSRNFIKAISAKWHKGFSSDENKIFGKVVLSLLCSYLRLPHHVTTKNVNSVRKTVYSELFST